jgi:NAD(P)-dependent dehydrogenase (short-subunit alcohol dehydrogenase family)/3-oxoacyl-(acyl-carrier-protein) synthase
MGDLDGRLVLVTGGSGDVGRAIAKELGARGAHVLLNFFHSPQGARRTAAELEAMGARVDLLRASVARPAQVERMFGEIEERYGHLDVLVNNAASGALLPLGEVTEEHLDRAFDTNVKGSLWCARAAAPLMARRGGGSIVNISALGGSQLVMANYVACGPAKAAVEALTRYLAVEYAALGIRVNTASAAMLVSTVADAFPRAGEMQQAVAAATPLGRLGTPEEFAQVVAFLASDQSRWITGQVVLADGGLSLGAPLLAPPARPADVGARPASPEPEPEEDAVAVVGMGVAVAGASSPDELWRVLLEGPNLFVPVPEERWHSGSFHSPDRAAEDKAYQDTCVFITDLAAAGAGPADEYTTAWLRHSLRQALAGVRMRPDDRCSFLVGYTPDGSQHLEEAGVLAGARHRLRELVARLPAPEAERGAFAAEVETALCRRYRRGAIDPHQLLPDGVARVAMAGVLPPGTDVRVVDTACSSSLYAIDIGVKGLLMGRHDVAVCGGAFALAPRGTVLFSKLQGLSARGEVRALDRDSDGVIFADGAGVVVLKRLSRALADGDPVLALVRGFGCSSDGRGRAIYAPNPAGQALAVRRALERPAVAGEHVDWIVAHATGTPAGDLAEFGTMREHYRSDRAVQVTSNKSVIGHTGWAAGVVSLIEVVLALRHGTIPPQHRFTGPPDDFGIADTNLAIPTRPVPWPARADRPRAAAISGFGFGGTNAHLVVEEHRGGRPPAAAAAAAAGEGEGEGEERIAVVAWSAHVPGPEPCAAVEAWLRGQGPAPPPRFGDAYPAPPLDRVKLPPSTVRAIDRCQLMALECAQQLRERTGAFWDEHSERTGVFIGHLGSTRAAVLYANRCYLDDVEAALRAHPPAAGSPLLEPLLAGLREEVRGLVPPSTEDAFPGMMPNVIPARVASALDLRGPNMTLDGGLASALLAIDTAAAYLRTGEIDLALAGGVNGNSTPEMRHLVRALLPAPEPELAEGAFLLALTTERAAEAAGLPVLALLDLSPPSGEGDRLECGAPDAGGYLGAAGALAVLRALHRPGRTVVAGPDSGQRLAVSPAAGPARVRRYVQRLAPAPAEPHRDRVPFCRADALVLTDRPELLAELGDAFAGATVLDACDAAAAAGLAGRRFRHVRVVADLERSAPVPDCLTCAAEPLLALHRLVFAALGAGWSELDQDGASFLSLFLGGTAAGTPHPYAGLFGGLVKCADLELDGCLTHALFTDARDVRRGVEEAEAETAARRHLPVVFSDRGRRLVPVVAEAPLPGGAQPRLDRDSVVLAVGGARGITAEVLKGLAARVGPRLYLIGSNPLDAYPREVLESDPRALAERRPAFLRERMAAGSGGSVAAISREFDRLLQARDASENIRAMATSAGPDRVRYLCCDVTDREAVARTVAEVVREAGRIDLLVSAAGRNRSGLIRDKDVDEFTAIRDLKVRAHLNLKHALRDHPPRMWCSFGSLLGLVGQRGEADYASGNDFLSSAAMYAAGTGADEWVIGWTLWDSVGMGANPLTRAYFERADLYTHMATEEGVEHFLEELAAPAHDASVVHMGEAERRTIERYVPGFLAGTPVERAFFLRRQLERSSEETLHECVFDMERDAYLGQHLVRGQPSLAGSFVVEIAAEAALDLMPGLQVVALERLVFHHFLTLHAGQPAAKRIHARVAERSDERVAVDVRVLTDVVAPGGRVLVRDRVHFEARVLLGRERPPAERWEHWDALGERAVPDPYLMPASPVLLTGVFASTRDHRAHPLGKRARYTPPLRPDHPALSRFRTPCVLLDGLARVGVLGVIAGHYVPVVTPTSIRRVVLGVAANDCELVERYGHVELYCTPPGLPLRRPDATNGFVAAAPDGTVVARMEDVAGVPIGYVHDVTGELISPEKLEELASGVG